MIKILGLFPLKGNGGIGSWARTFIATFSNEEFQLVVVDIAPEQDFTKIKGVKGAFYGIKAFVRIIHDIKKTIKDNPDIKIMHTTTSSGKATLRDYFIVRLCQKKGIKSIMHCRFGAVTEFYQGKSIWSRLFRINTKLFDQTWVLDKRSFLFLHSIPDISNKIELTPNSIEVPNHIDIKPCNYKKIGFVGNIIPTKGIFELIKAFENLDNETHLYIAGVGSERDIKHMVNLIGDKMGQNIHFLGKLPNQEAVKLINSLDIICLPTYFWGEAFPISILEAMSRGKIVISCSRAAIPDMLTSLDGSLCGLLVTEKSASGIADAIMWCQIHQSEADKLRVKAFEKAKTCYRKEVVYDIYRSNYKKLLSSVEL